MHVDELMNGNELKLLKNKSELCFWNSEFRISKLRYGTEIYLEFEVLDCTKHWTKYIVFQYGTATEDGLPGISKHEIFELIIKYGTGTVLALKMGSNLL